MYYEKAFALSKSTKDTILTATIGANLLMQYIKSYDFQKQQDSLAKELNNLSMVNLPTHTKLQVFNAVIAFYSANDRQGMCQFILTQAKPVCEAMMISKSLNYMDSFNIENYLLYQGICYSRMNDTSWIRAWRALKKVVNG